MVVAPAITWLFVTTVPVADSTIPVAATRPRAPLKVVVMSTTDRSMTRPIATASIRATAAG